MLFIVNVMLCSGFLFSVSVCKEIHPASFCLSLLLSSPHPYTSAVRGQISNIMVAAERISLETKQIQKKQRKMLQNRKKKRKEKENNNNLKHFFKQPASKLENIFAPFFFAVPTLFWLF